jgi:hypothetical protein
MHLHRATLMLCIEGREFESLLHKVGFLLAYTSRNRSTLVNQTEDPSSKTSPQFVQTPETFMLQTETPQGSFPSAAGTLWIT